MLDVEPTPITWAMPYPWNDLLIAVFLAGVILFFVVMIARRLTMTPAEHQAIEDEEHAHKTRNGALLNMDPKEREAFFANNARRPPR